LDQLKEAIELYETILQEDKEFHRLLDHDQPKEIDDDQASSMVISSNVALEGIVRHNMGKLRVQLGDHEAAMRDLTMAIELKTAATGDPHHPEMAKTWNSLGTCHAVLGDRSKALECFKQSLLICRMHHDEDDPEVMLALRNIAVLKGEKVPKWGT
jgi:tetratricopeptide (TPR) repeat protein